MFTVKSHSITRRMKGAIPTSAKHMLVRLFCNPIIGGIIQLLPVSRSLVGGSFDYKLVDGKSAAKIFFGIWESAEIGLSKRFAENDVIIELGSSVGVTFGVLHRLFRNTKYICVEASPRTFGILGKQVEHCGRSCSSDVVLLNKAIGYENAGYIYFQETSFSGSQRDTEEVPMGSSIKVPCVTLNDIVDEFSKDKTYTLITDIEGSEAEIFFKDGRSLENCSKIICELEDTKEYTQTEQIEQLKKVGFEVIEQYANVFYLSR